MHKPKHIGIIMDGNGRWAQLRSKARTFGHIKGARVAKKIITACAAAKVENLTLYTFSTENWLRPKEEVGFLLSLLGRYLKKEVANLVRQNIKFTVIGDLDRLPSELLSIVSETIAVTANNTGMNLTFAISYGSRWEIVETAKKIATQVQLGRLDVSQINESVFAKNLLSSPYPDLDLVIRTSGETRLSNFMLWQAAYAELIFTKTLWPDFTAEELNSLLMKYIKTERRFGTVATTNEHIFN